MILQLNLQIYILLCAIASGLLLGLLFDLYRIIRGNGHNQIIIFFEDILFFILAALIIYTFLLYLNYAFITIYVYAFIFLTAFLYFKFLSFIVVKIESYLLNLVFKLVRVIIKNLIYPFKLILSKIRIKKIK